MNLTQRTREIVDNCRFCWMCRHVCPVGNVTGQERNNARARALAVSLVARGAQPLEDIVDNLYECTLCGACTNNCVTGWDPKVFVQEVKTEAALSGLMPAYISELLERYMRTGNVYGAEAVLPAGGAGDTAVFFGQDAACKSPGFCNKVMRLLAAAGEDPAVADCIDSGAALWFLTGKTRETQEAAKKCAALLSGYQTVVVYDPVDLAFMLHEYREWGIEVAAKLIGLGEYLLSLLQEGKLRVKKGRRVYTLQDSYAAARDLDDVTTGRTLIGRVGKNKEMLLHGKEANMAGSLLMHEYMPDVMEGIARARWREAVNTDCRTLVTCSPAEYVLLNMTAPEGCRAISLEELLLENMEETRWI